jgi:hypothetical protein
MEPSRLIAELDDEADTFGAISEATWRKHRHTLRYEIAQAARLHAALAKLAKMVGHYTYSRENREALAEANKVLSEYQPAVEPPTDE